MATLTPEELFCLEGCRTYAQYYEMRKRFEKGICPFCHLDRSINPVLFENSEWTLFTNAFPRKSLAMQLLLVPKRHIRHLEELSLEAWVEFHEVFQWMKGSIYTGKGGIWFGRFGDMTLNAGTVPHFHWNYWVPNGSGTVEIPVLKDPDRRELNTERAAEFAKLYARETAPST